MQIGIAGLGRMGAAMAARLMEVGHTLTVWNRSPGKAQAAKGGGGAVRSSGPARSGGGRAGGGNLPPNVGGGVGAGL